MISREGNFSILSALVVGGLLSYGASFIDHWSAYIFYAISLFLVVFMLYFFRDPERDVPDEENLLLSPADGKIVLVKEVNEPVYLKQKATQISIFLSPLDVHVNRVPATGTVEYAKYNPGKYLMAWDHNASEMNERADFGVRHTSGTPVFFRQITGFMARRIVYHLREGDQVKAGERFGMMKFGSRMDILVPSNVKLIVKEGQRTIAGETILGNITSHGPSNPDDLDPESDIYYPQHGTGTVQGSGV